jgi:hypothetical protein
LLKILPFVDRSFGFDFWIARARTNSLCVKWFVRLSGEPPTDARLGAAALDVEGADVFAGTALLLGRGSLTSRETRRLILTAVINYRKA